MPRCALPCRPLIMAYSQLLSIKTIRAVPCRDVPCRAVPAARNGFPALYKHSRDSRLPSHDLSGEGISLAVDHIHTFLTTQGHGGHAQMSDQLNAGATSETTLKSIYIIHSHIYSNKADMRRMIMMVK